MESRRQYIFRNDDVARALRFVSDHYSYRLSQIQGILPRGESDPHVEDPPLSERMLLYKVFHTARVVDAMLVIAPDEALVSGMCAALLHDIERATQSMYGSFSDSATGFDHATHGANMVEASTMELQDKDAIVIAIREHSLAIPRVQSPLVGLTRDADKIAILQEEIMHLAAIGDLHRAQHPIREEVFGAWAVGQLVANDAVPRGSLPDRLVQRLSWIHDIATKAAAMHLHALAIFPQILQVLRIAAHPDDTNRVAAIEMKIGDWQESVLETVSQS